MKIVKRSTANITALVSYFFEINYNLIYKTRHITAERFAEMCLISLLNACRT